MLSYWDTMSDTICQICSLSHGTIDHLCSVHLRLKLIAHHSALTCPLRICDFCNTPKGHSRAHTTMEHKCRICSAIGQHASFNCPQRAKRVVFEDMNNGFDITECCICLNSYQPCDVVLQFACGHCVHDKCCNDKLIKCPYCRGKIIK